MDRVKNATRGSTSPKSVTATTSIKENLQFEPMAEYKPTRDEEDLAHFGIKQQLEVRDSILFLHAYICSSCGNHLDHSETLASCPS